MGAERMVTTWFAGFLFLWNTGYQARHRSKRRAGAGAGRPAQSAWEVTSCAEAGRPAEPASPETGPWMASPTAEPDFLEELADGQLRRMLEGCALEDLTRIIPEIVQVIARSSADTMTTAWNDFREATRSAGALRLGAHHWPEFLDRANLGSYPEEDAVVIKLGEADDALWLITNGPPYQAIRSR
jgi:hypothetical protein